VVCQNKNEFSLLPRPFKVLNLEIERSDPLEDLLASTVNTQFADYLNNFTNEELTKQFLFSENSDMNLF
jgi:hypothetical protein